MRTLFAIGAILQACVAVKIDQNSAPDFTIIEVAQPASIAQLSHKAKKMVKIGNMHAALQMEANRRLIAKAGADAKEAAKAASAAEEAEKEAEGDLKKKDDKDDKAGPKEKPAETQTDAKADEKKTEEAAAKANAKADAKAAAKASVTEEQESKKGDDAKTAEDVAAEADKAKAAKLRTFAKEKLDKVLRTYEELDGHLKEKFAALEKVLMDTEINVSGFDPKDEADIKWLTGEMEKILNGAPEIKHLEEKLKAVDDVHPALDKVLKDLEKITDITKMVIPTEDVAAASPVNSNGTTNGTASASPSAASGNGTANVTSESPSAKKNATATAAGNATAPAATAGNATAPAASGKAATPAAPAKADAAAPAAPAAAAPPADAKKAAVQVSSQKAQARAIISASLKDAVKAIFKK